jgi:hypothetical protein
MYELFILSIVAFVWLCGSVFSLVSIIATHKIRKIPVFPDGLDDFICLGFLCFILSPTLGLLSWIQLVFDTIKSKYDFTTKLNEWTSK